MSEQPLDLETAFRRSAAEASGGALDTDTLEAIAAVACEAIGDDLSAAGREALREAVAEVLADAGVSPEMSAGILDALVAVASHDGSRKGDGDSKSDASVNEGSVDQPGLFSGQLSRMKAIGPLLAPLRVREATSEQKADAAASAGAGAATGDAKEATLDGYEETADSLEGGDEPPATDNALTTPKRWRTRGDVESERAAKYLQEVGEVAAAERERQAQHEVELAEYFGRRHGDVEAVVTTSIGAGDFRPTGGDDDDDSSDDEISIRDREATKRRLRQLGEPATFFGETSAARSARLRALELGRDQDVLATGSTNVMQILDRRAERLGVAPEERDEEDYVSRTTQHDFKRAMPSASAIRDGGASSSDEDIPSKKARSSGGASQALSLVPLGGGGADGATNSLAGEFPWEEDGSKAEQEAAAEAEEEDEEVQMVSLWLRNTLRDWETWLIERSKAEGSSTALNTERANFRQSKQYLRPLRRALRDSSVGRGMIRSIAAVASACERRDYKEAKESYMRLAIGNQAWPMGITMVTFHDRANRHKISEDSVSHILNDETTRKYVQMVKRLVSFHEQRWPVDPSLAA
eukprot:TRINITY_DN18408_c0_g1_i1.p1 TRINITY_DN18408_c0_g1~~TRINITY_DN18408_c0_g1_i1.p1  ORF type:complete len:628 (+),score=132.99 TRINITY_DN18408_c0_g1_i1:139-1884(+)